MGPDGQSGTPETREETGRAEHLIGGHKRGDDSFPGPEGTSWLSRYLNCTAVFNVLTVAMLPVTARIANIYYALTTC